MIPQLQSPDNLHHISFRRKSSGCWEIISSNNTWVSTNSTISKLAKTIMPLMQETLEKMFNPGELDSIDTMKFSKKKGVFYVVFISKNGTFSIIIDNIKNKDLKKLQPFKEDVAFETNKPSPCLRLNEIVPSLMNVRNLH